VALFFIKSFDRRVRLCLALRKLLYPATAAFSWRQLWRCIFPTIQNLHRTSTCHEIIGGAKPVVPFLDLPATGKWWPAFLFPSAIVALALAINIWHDLPAAARRHLSHRRKQDREINFGGITRSVTIQSDQGSPPSTPDKFQK
jgi:hypothetical protein